MYYDEPPDALAQAKVAARHCPCHGVGVYFCYNSTDHTETMTRETTIRAIGNSAGTTLPKAMLDRYKLAEGDRVHLIETENGILMTPYDPNFVDAMRIYQEGARTYRNALKELAR
jgi:putative addiction module antidote